MAGQDRTGRGKERLAGNQKLVNKIASSSLTVDCESAGASASFCCPTAPQIFIWAIAYNLALL